MHWLPQIVAGRCQETRLGQIGSVGQFLLAQKIVGEIKIGKLQLKRLYQQLPELIGKSRNHRHPKHRERGVGPMQSISIQRRPDAVRHHDAE